MLNVHEYVNVYKTDRLDKQFMLSNCIITAYLFHANDIKELNFLTLTLLKLNTTTRKTCAMTVTTTDTNRSILSAMLAARLGQTVVRLPLP